MKPKYYQADSSHRDRWMVSYLDAVTILLIFFVAAAARTMPARVKPPDPPPPPKPAIVDARPRTPDPLEKRLTELGLEFHKESRGLVISLPQTVLFASGDDRIGPNAYPVIDQIATVLEDIPNQIILVGHADSVPIHTARFPSNWELSAARGLRLLQVLHSRYGIDERRISIASDGANRPASSNDTAEGRAGNRRVEIVVVRQTQGGDIGF